MVIDSEKEEHLSALAKCMPENEPIILSAATTAMFGRKNKGASWAIQAVQSLANQKLLKITKGHRKRYVSITPEGFAFLKRRACNEA